MTQQQQDIRPTQSLQDLRLSAARAELFCFGHDAAVAELHAMIHADAQQPDGRAIPFRQQLEAVVQACRTISRAYGATVVVKRYFLSDIANQAAIVEHLDTDPCAKSIVGQPPLDGSKIALWAYLMTGVEVSSEASGETDIEANSLTDIGASGQTVEVVHGAYRHLWSVGNSAVPSSSPLVPSSSLLPSSSEAQSQRLFADYADALRRQGCTLRDHCLRTWLFVRDIDHNYYGLVKARNDVFAREGLTAHTHFIASTGIGGRPRHPQALVQMDAYAVGGLSDRQLTYLHAPTHLGRTTDYGVSFERATRVDYGDRRHVFVSGTASIDPRGQIVHEGDVERQALRMLDNVEALLREADCDFGDVAHAVVYLRDPADRPTVGRVLHERLSGRPCVLVLAPVCRPGWLVEMECVAIRAQHRPDLPQL